MSRVQQIAEATPTWANWLIIGGAWLVAAVIPVLQALAFLVTIVWGGMQAYSWIVNRGWRRKGR
jgi:hypothetical protein